MLLSTGWIYGSVFYGIVLILCYPQQLEVMVLYWFYVTLYSWNFWDYIDFMLLSTLGSYGIVLILFYRQQLKAMAFIWFYVTVNIWNLWYCIDLSYSQQLELWNLFSLCYSQQLKFMVFYWYYVIVNSWKLWNLINFMILPTFGIYSIVLI
jgi:hypothetical protein